MIRGRFATAKLRLGVGIESNWRSARRLYLHADGIPRKAITLADVQVLGQLLEVGKVSAANTIPTSVAAQQGAATFARLPITYATATHAKGYRMVWILRQQS